MNIPRIDDLPPDMVRAVRDAEAALRAAQDTLSAEILGRVGLAKGDVVEDPDTGLRYCVTGVHAGLTPFGTTVHILGRRLWKEGRKAGKTAMTESSLYSRVVKVETP